MSTKLDLNKLKTSAQQARQQLDHVLLNLNHSGLNRIATGWKEVPGASQSVDLVNRIGQNVLERAQLIRESLITSRPIRRAKTATRVTRKRIKRIKSMISSKGGKPLS
jgi:hypothetical protein